MPPTKHPAQRMQQPPAAIRPAAQMAIMWTVAQAPAPAPPGHQLLLVRAGNTAECLKRHAQAGTILGGRSCAKRHGLHWLPRRPLHRCALHAPASGWLKMPKERLMICPRNNVKLPGGLLLCPHTCISCVSDPPPAKKLCLTLQVAISLTCRQYRRCGGRGSGGQAALAAAARGAAVDPPPLLPSPSHDSWALMSLPPQFLHFPPQAASPASSNGAAGAAAEEVSLLVTRGRSCRAHLTAYIFLPQAASPASSNGAAGAAAEEVTLTTSAGRSARGSSCRAHLTSCFCRRRQPCLHPATARPGAQPGALPGPQPRR